jgi:plastocyanin
VAREWGGALASVLVVVVGSPRPGPPPRSVASDPGRIEGVASIAPVLTGTRARIRVYDEPGTPPPKRERDGQALANVVIYLNAAPALRGVTPPIVHATAALHQRDETFVPHVLPVVVGTTVEFTNDDPLFHDVFSLSSVRAFDLQRFPQGTSRTVAFSKPGVVEVFCHIHADMSAYILVLGNAFFVSPDSSGHFALDGVPPGDYQLVAWYERSHPVVTRVHVDAGRTTRQDVRIPIPAS